MAKMEKGLVIRAAAFLMIVQVLSRILGYLRDVLLLNMFGQGYATDAYNAAFSIPDFLYTVLIGGAISCAFIPVFSSYIAQKNEEAAWRTCSIFTSWALMFLVAFEIAAFLFAPGLMRLLTDFGAGQLALPVFLTRLTLIQCFFMALSAISTGVLQSYQHFTWPALGALFYNIAIIFGGIFLCGPIEARWPGYGVAGFSVGVVVGSVITLLVQVPMLKKVGFRWFFSLDTHDPGLRQLIKLIIPVLIGLSVAQINLFVTQKLATGLEPGVYTALRTANRFMQLPLGIFATAIATAIFPTMTAQAAVNEMDEMKQSLSLGVRTTLLVILPSAVGLALLARPVIRLLFEFSGNFTAADTRIAATALVFYAIGLAGYAATQILIRGFYAIKNTVLPVSISIAAIVINIVFSLLLVGPLDYIGLALAYSIAGLAQCGLLVVFLRRKIGRIDLRRIAGSVLRALIACAVMAAGIVLVLWGSNQLLDIGNKLFQLLQVGLACLAGVGLFLLAARRMKMPEMELVMELFGKRLRRRKKAAPPADAVQPADRPTNEGENDHAGK